MRRKNQLSFASRASLYPPWPKWSWGVWKRYEQVASSIATNFSTFCPEIISNIELEYMLYPVRYYGLNSSIGIHVTPHGRLCPVSHDTTAPMRTLGQFAAQIYPVFTGARIETTLAASHVASEKYVLGGLATILDQRETVYRMWLEVNCNPKRISWS